MILIWQFGESHKDRQIKCISFIEPLILKHSAHEVVLITANLNTTSSHKLPNTWHINNSTYMALSLLQLSIVTNYLLI